MKKLKIILLIIIILNIFLLSSCWNYREINTLAIVSGITIDKSPTDGNYSVTFEIVKFKGKSKETKMESEIIESEGKTLFDAVRNAIRLSTKRLFWSHAKNIILSQDITRDGIIDIIDFIVRDQEPREQINILISKEKTAKELYEPRGILTNIKAFEIENMIKYRKSLSQSPEAQIHNIINMLSGDGINLTLPAIGLMTNQGNGTLELSGTAIFDKDKLVGFLSPEDSKYFLFLKDNIKGGLLTLKEIAESSHDDITLEILKSETDVTPTYSNEKFTMNVDVNTKVSIAEIDMSKNVIDEKGRQSVKEDAERMLKQKIENTFKHVQENYGVDAFGFGSIIKEQNPNLWKKISKNWHSIFESLAINVTVEIDIKASGLASKPIKIGDIK